MDKTRKKRTLLFQEENAGIDAEESDQDSGDERNCSGYDNSLSDDKDDEEEDMDSDSDLQVEFEFINQGEEHMEAVQLMLRGLLGTPYDCSDLAELFVKSEVGSVIVVSGSNEPLGFIGVVNLLGSCGSWGVKQVLEFILAKTHSFANDPSLEEKFRRLIDGELGPVGLLLNERLPNLPDELAAPLHSTFFEEIDSSDNSEYHFTHYLMISQYREGREGSRGVKRQKFEREFAKSEEEVYDRHASLKFSYPRSGQKASGDKGLILLIPRQAVSLILEEMK